MKIVRITWSLVISLSLASVVRAAPDIDAHAANLTSEDANVAEDAQRILEAKGADAVPVLFDKLQDADWALRPRLLEVLSKHGREYAKQKLHNGKETERIYAALVYELTRAAQPDDYDTPDFRAMVEALLNAIKSEDKYLRAAAGAALVYDEKSTSWFEHFHDIIPGLIASFDTGLIIDRRERGGPTHCVLIVICGFLQGSLGDQFAYSELENKWSKEPTPNPDATIGKRQAWEKFVSGKHADLDTLRSYWQGWWHEHKHLNAREIGMLMIQRNLEGLKGINTSTGYTHGMAASAHLNRWTGKDFFTAEEAVRWWERNRNGYSGPPR